LEGRREQVFSGEARHALVQAAAEAVVGALPSTRVNIDSRLVKKLKRTILPELTVSPLPDPHLAFHRTIAHTP
jgi:hypothetical protein